MKFQPKRFVVEVKRGTSRAAFASPDASADRFGSAEAMLFGGGPRSEPEPSEPDIAKAAGTGGRILRSLVEPPPPVMEEPPAPARRGRKPGSKNKPKPQIAASAPVADPEPLAERPRRGRKPGSKNKPKLPVAIAFPPAAAGSRYGTAAAMRSYGFADDGTVWTDAATPAAPVPSPPPPAPVAPPRVEEGDAPRVDRFRARLRDRSTILKRYVLDIEPRPGQPGALRARRLARAAP